MTSSLPQRMMRAMQDMHESTIFCHYNKVNLTKHGEFYIEKDLFSCYIKQIVIVFFFSFMEQLEGVAGSLHTGYTFIFQLMKIFVQMSNYSLFVYY